MTEPGRARRGEFRWTSDDRDPTARAMVLVPSFARRPEAPADGCENSGERSDETRLAEARGLAEAISLRVVESGIVPVKRIRPATLFGAGKTDEIAGIVKAAQAGLVIVDFALTPVQQRNLEKAWNAKVLDRTGLILEIFGERARTREGRLQVELANLNYQKGRLVRQWTHLERQRGGLGKTGGPGETQIEADRRLIQERIIRLERDLAKVRRTRSLHRSKRKKRPSPVIALVGYTNAGKSTLFNRLTNATVVAKDMLFATLDPTLREIVLPQGTRAILSDTVGFISNLPTTLVAAFHATLEEVVEADLIVHVRDISDPDHRAQAADVNTVLEQIGIDAERRGKVIEVWNKIDRLDPAAATALRSAHGAHADAFVLSALTGEGITPLLASIEARLGGGERLMDIHLSLEELGVLPWVYDNAEVIDRSDEVDGSVSMRVRIQPGARAAFLRYAG